MTRISKGCVIAVSLAVTGCVQIPKEAGFPDVREAVSQRIGHHVHWYQGTSEDQHVTEVVNQMLADHLTIEETVQIALLNNRQLQAMYEDLGVAQAAVVQAGLLRNPVFNLSAQFPIDSDQTELTLSIIQDFLHVLFMPQRKAIAEADFAATKLRVTAKVMDHAARTRAAFYRVQADEQLLEMLQQVMQAAASAYDAAKRLHDAGNIRDLDLHNEQSLYDQTKLDLAVTEAVIMRNREHLNSLMGVWGTDTQWKIINRLPEINEHRIDLEDIEKRAVQRSLDLAIARKDIESVGQQLGLTKASALVPELERGAEAEREEGEWEVGPTLALPISLFDQGQARIATAQAELRRQRQRYTALAVQIRSAARAARDNLVFSRRTALHYHSVLLPLKQQILDETLLQYNAMQIGVFQLLIAKRQQIETGRRYIEALYGYWRARVGLEQILSGRLPNLGPTEPMVATIATASMQAAEGGH